MPHSVTVVDEQRPDDVLSPDAPTDDAGSDDVKPVRPEMSAEQMRAYLTEVGGILAMRGLTGELVLAGGAVMVMALEARGSLESLFE